jgi:hypothetical protein
MEDEYPADRVPRHRLPEQSLDGRMDMRDPHRPDLIGHHFAHGIQYPSRTARPLPSTHDDPWLGITASEISQLLGQTAQPCSGLLHRQLVRSPLGR